MSLFRVLPLLFFSTLSLASDSNGPRDPTKSERLSIEAGVRENLRDPDSAQFRRIKLGRDGPLDIACGEVNAKNAFGGYIGFSRFFAMLLKIEDGEFGVVHVEIDKSESPVASLMCEKHGL